MDHLRDRRDHGQRFFHSSKNVCSLIHRSWTLDAHAFSLTLLDRFFDRQYSLNVFFAIVGSSRVRVQPAAGSKRVPLTTPCTGCSKRPRRTAQEYAPG